MKAHHIGLIGLDTSHVTAFARLLNDPSDQHYRPGPSVSCAWPGGSPDFELSAGRVAEFTMDLRERRGVEILDSPEAVAEACDISLHHSRRWANSPGTAKTRGERRQTHVYRQAICPFRG